MGRFLICFSYFGTRYSGVQEQRGLAVKTVGGVLMDALKHLRPSNEVKLTLSSRTDKGVHALANSCHVDLVNPCDGKEFSPSVITNVMNYHLMKQQEEIRILQTRQVADSFNCRHISTGRKYVYRLAHVLGSGTKSILGSQTDNSDTLFQELKRHASRRNKRIIPWGESLDVFNSNKAAIYRTELDISKLVTAAEMLSGIHNYLCFTCQRKVTDPNLPHPVKMLTIGVKRGHPFGHPFHKYSSCGDNNLEFWDIHVQSKSFMYKQVRRLVGAMVLVAKNIISLEDLQDLLNNPRNDFPFSGQMSAREEGLFLLSVDYPSKDLEFSTTVQANNLEFSETVQANNLPEQQELSHDADAVSASCANIHHGDGLIKARTCDEAGTNDGEDSKQIAEDDVGYCLPVTQTDSVIVSSPASCMGISQSA